MIYLIKSIGILIVIAGVLFAALPELMLRFIAFLKQGKRAYAVGVGRIVIGGLLLWACPLAAIVWIPATLGGLMVLSGIVVFALGMARVQAVLGWWERRPVRLRQALAVLAACLGALLIYAA